MPLGSLRWLMRFAIQSAQAWDVDLRRSCRALEISSPRRGLLLCTKAAVRAASTRMNVGTRISAPAGEALACD
jgi:hypothetical protein